jgi:hypothetical protein
MLRLLWHDVVSRNLEDQRCNFACTYKSPFPFFNFDIQMVIYFPLAFIFKFSYKLIEINLSKNVR